MCMAVLRSCSELAAPRYGPGARGDSPAAFERRLHPAWTALLLGRIWPNMLPRRALPRGSLVTLGATRGFATDSHRTADANPAVGPQAIELQQVGSLDETLGVGWIGAELDTTRQLLCIQWQGATLAAAPFLRYFGMMATWYWHSHLTWARL